MKNGGSFKGYKEDKEMALTLEEIVNASAQVWIKELEQEVKDKDAVIQGKDAVIQGKDAVIQDKDAEIAMLREKIRELTAGQVVPG